MDTEKALSIIKQVMDAALKGGVLPNMDAAFTAANAYNAIAQALNVKKENGSNLQ